MSKLTKIMAGVTLAASLGAWSQVNADLQYSLVPEGTFTANTPIYLDLKVTSNVAVAQFYDSIGGSLNDAAAGGSFGAFQLDAAFPTTWGNSAGSGAGTTVTGLNFHATNPVGVPTGVSINTGTLVTLGKVLYTPAAGNGPFTVNFVPQTGHTTASQVWTEAGVEKDDISLTPNNGTVTSTPATLAVASGIHILNGQTVSYTKPQLDTADSNGTSTITIDNGGTMVLTEDTVSTRQTGAVVNQIDGTKFTNNGLLDMKNRDLVIHNASYATIHAMLASGFNGGGWDGTHGITNTPSSVFGTTVAIASGDDYINYIGNSTFDGVTVASTDVLLKVTYYGDLNMDGIVDGNDVGYFTALYDPNAAVAAPYVLGDLTYTGVVDGNAVGYFTAFFDPNNPYPGATGLASGGPVPEPASLGLLTIGGALLMLRKSRK